MDEASVTRPVPIPEESLVAGSHLCDQVARLLGVGEKASRGAFLGEPVGVVLAMAGWALSRREQEGFDPEVILPAWAKDRGRGIWRTEDRRVEDCDQCRDRDPRSTAHRGGRGLPSCPACRGSGFVLKPLGLLSEGGETARRGRA
jgi:hypothetical protein